MQGSANMKLSLIIEAYNRTQAAWSELSAQSEKAKAEAVTLYDAYGKPIQKMVEHQVVAASTGAAVAAAGQTAARGWGAIAGKIREAITQTESFKLRAGELDGFLAQGIGIGTFLILLREAKLAIDTIEKTGNSLRGLAAISRYSGETIGQSISAGMSLAEDGLINVQEASQSLQNLLSRGFTLQEAIEMINRLKDAAAFNRQAHLTMGQAITSATEGIKNENSILVDNAGVTKNVSVMWKEYALQHGKAVDGLSQAEKRQAEYNGIMRETEGQVGNAKLAIEGITGAKAKLSQEVFKLRNALGEGETSLFFTLAKGFGWALENLRAFLGGIEILAVKMASFWDKLSIRKDIALSGKGVFSQEGLNEYEKRVKTITEAEDAQIAEIIAKWEGKVTAPNIGRDSGKRRTDTILPDKKEMEKAAKYRDEVRKIFADLDTGFEKASWSDKSTQRLEEIKNKYADLMAKLPKERATLQEKMDREIQQAEEEGWEEWQKEIDGQSKKATAAAEKIRDAIREVDEDISANTTSELDKRLAVQDKFYWESLEKLEKAGVDFDTIIAKEVEIFAAAEKKKAQIRNEYANQQRQAEIGHELAQVDYREKGRTISKDTAITERIRLTSEYLALQERELGRLADLGSAGKDAWLSQQAAIDGTRQKRLNLQLQARDLSNDMAGGFREGLLQYVDETGGGFKRMVDLARSSAQGMEAAFSDFFFDVMTGKLKSFGDYITSFLNSVARAMANMMAQSAAKGIVGSLGSLFSTATSLASSGGASPLGIDASVLVAHQGGLIMPRFHFGGLVNDEVPAILQTRERVLSREQNVLFENFVNKTSGGGGAPQIQIVINNQGSQNLAARQTSGPRFDGQKWVIETVANDIANHGVLGQMLAR